MRCALAKAFECGVNDLPLSLVLSWYEQKAVAVLLTLLHLGVRNIRIGPTLPAFLSPAVLGLLHEKFNLMAITTAEKISPRCLPDAPARRSDPSPGTSRVRIAFKFKSARVT